MTLKKVTTNITYKVPAWHRCNHVSTTAFGRPSTTKCRFCVKTKEGYICTLYNAVLETESKDIILKTHECERATAGYNSRVEDVEDTQAMPQVDPKQIAKAAIKSYTSMLKQLRAQGYPEALASQLAMEYVIGG